MPGEDLPHVSHYYTEPHEFYRRRVVVVGGKNSAAEAALDLYRSGAEVTLVHRRAELGASIKYWVRPDIENRIKEGSIAARFETRVVEIRPREVVVERAGVRETLPAEGVFLLTGYLADLDFLRRAGIEVAANNVPRHDPDSFETNVPGLYPGRCGRRRRQPGRGVHRERPLPRAGRRRSGVRLIDPGVRLRSDPGVRRRTQASA